MIIGVISDTHIPGKATALPAIVLESFKTADHIIHAGDISSPAVIRSLEAIAPVTAVAGNIDPPKLQQTLGFKKIITLGGFRFGIVHGHGAGGTTVKRAVKAFEYDNVGCIVFGHSHIPYCGQNGDMLLFNPGSPTDKRRNEYYSFGIIEFELSINPRIFFFDSRQNITKILRI